MANNPIQVVLNARDYQIVPERTGGGSVKDFYAGRNQQFSEHKDRLLVALDQIGARLSKPGGASVEYAHVVLEEEAWAKTKRPTQKIFPPGRVAIVGGGYIGDMIVEVTSDNFDSIRGSVNSAEVEVPKVENRKTGKIEPKPSKERSEVGAIRELRLHRSDDRRSFSAEDAVKWLSDPRTGGMYWVETFVDPRKSHGDEFLKSRRRAVSAFDSLKGALKNIGLQISIQDTEDRWSHVRLILVGLASKAIADHEKLLRFLDDQAIVSKVSLPPILEAQHAAISNDSGTVDINPPVEGSPHPVVCVVDTGIAEVPQLDSWCVGRTNPAFGASHDRSHGTFIAGLGVAALELNHHPIFSEIPCKFFDMGLHPTSPDVYDDFYPRGFIDFLEQLDAEIPEAVSAGARVFNMSLSIRTQVKDDGYSAYAALLDEISDRHNIIFVLPAGNLDAPHWRPQWPKESDGVVEMLAGYVHQGKDRLFQPAESIRSITVGAVDPPDDEGGLYPSVYTRRGPSTSLGVKPDIAHIGGRGGPDAGLNSISVSGTLSSGCGTSYAAPLGARTIAALDHLIEGEVERETLSALLVHHADCPESLSNSKVRKYVPDFVGHGIPLQASNILLTGDHSVTLTFVGNLLPARELVFPFTWPASLVGAGGSCRGRAKVTLAYRAPIDSRFGAEYVRIHMDCFLRQEEVDTATGEVSWKGRLKAEGKLYERHLIEHGHKWWPVKKYDRTFPRGVGVSSQWRLVVESLNRTNTEMSKEGVPFAVVLTLEDIDGAAPVFSELRQTLANSGVKLADIRTAQRIIGRA